MTDAADAVTFPVLAAVALWDTLALFDWLASMEMLWLGYRRKPRQSQHQSAG